MKDQLSKYKVIEEYPVHWGDMDSANHVNNLIYLRWGESGRLIYFKKIGIDISFKSANAGPILGWQDCKYIFPMTYPDTAIVGVRAAEIQKDRLIIECAIFSKKHQRIAAISKQSIIPYNYIELRKTDLPKEWIEGIERL